MAEFTPSPALVQFLTSLDPNIDRESSYRSLDGGVSADVVMVDTGRERIVVKRALAKLRVSADWHADPARLTTEARALAVVHDLMPHRIPEPLHCDGSYLAMQAAPPEWMDWKSELLHGISDLRVATVVGRALGDWQAATANDAAVATTFDSLSDFEALRLSPFYEAVADRMPHLKGVVGDLSVGLTQDRNVLVHGDLSPKNILCAPPADSDSRPVWVIDWEVAHFGSEIFDVAFMLSHLVLKSIRNSAIVPCTQAFLDGYSDARGRLADLDLVLRHVGVLCLARVVGKSPVDYLAPDEVETVMRMGTHLVRSERQTLDDLWRDIP